ncbi:DUF6531 domain-containing protein [Streptomyces sp. DW26H14]|uniref:DUF6531 domain-containing protein n=1 Tax=Streptomyces sp. DW26H14 TaxID=3435395 RepID=UPI00403E25B0
MSLEDEARKVLMKMGLYWPAANSGSLRHAADAWRTFAGAVDDVRTPVNNAATSLIHNNKGEAIDAFTVFWDRYAKGGDAGWISDLSKSAHSMAAALEKFADAVDDAVNKLWTRIGIDAAVIAGGIGLAIFTAGISAGVSGAAAEAIVELGTAMGVAVSTAVAEVAAGTLVAAAFGSLESVTVDLAVAQPLSVTAGLQKGFSLDEVTEAAKQGAIFGGVFGGAGGAAKAVLDKSDLFALPGTMPDFRPGVDELGLASRSAKATDCVNDPVDVATGAMLMPQRDLALPGVLALVFERTHLSSYRAGVCFGPSWASTLDECLQIDPEGVVFAAGDGMRLVYPVPEAGGSVLPVKGPRWPLAWDGLPDGVMTLTDPATGVVRTFSTPRPSERFGTAHLPLDSLHDRNGNRIDVERDVQARPLALRHSGGYYLAVDTQGPRVTALRLLDEAPSRYAEPEADARGTLVVRYGYDEAGDLCDVVNSHAGSLRFTYDDAHRMTSWTDRNGTSFTYVYDDHGRVVRTRGTDGVLSGSLSYDEAAGVTTYTNSLGAQSLHRYNAEGKVTEESDPLGNVTRTQWDAFGDQPLSRTDPLGRTTRYEYDAQGSPSAVILPDGTSAHAAYNELGLPVEVTEPGGAVWQYTYDAHGNQLAETDPLGAVTTRTYDKHGHLASVTDPAGNTTRATSNAAGLPVTVSDPLGNTTAVRRDTFGRIIELTDPLGHTTRTEWSTEGKPVRRTYPDGTRESWEWDGEGNLLAHTDQAGNTTRHTPGHFDVPAGRTDPDGTTYAFTHDTELRLTAVTNPQGLTWSYTYDEAGRPTAETDFNGRTLSYAYDTAGALALRTNGAGETSSFTRDALGRVTEQRTDSGDVTTFAYDAAGDLSEAANADAEIRIRRDLLGRVVSETVNGRTHSYTYDALGRRTSRTTPSGLLSTWTYDSAGRATALTSEAGTLRFHHDAAGRETQRLLNDTATLHQTWSGTNRLTSQSITDAPNAKPGTAPAILQHRAYAYREDGYLTEIRELTAGTRRYDLNTTGRVQGVHAHGWQETYAYDTAGNLTHADAPAHTAPGERDFTGTLIHRAGRTRYEHDPQGRLTRKTRTLLNGQSKTWTYTWNAEDRLTRTTTPDGETWRYTYDPLGRRVTKQREDTDEVTTFTWDGTRLAEQHTPDGRTTTWDYAPDTHTPLTQTTHSRPTSVLSLTELADEGPQVDRTTRFHAIVTDPVGTPTELVAAKGTLDWQYRTALWGTPYPTTTNSADTACPLRYAGQYADSETGLHYNHNRYYDPETARYLSPDPLGLEPAPNHHAFVANPFAWSDALGLSPCPPKPALSDPLPRGMSIKMAAAYDSVKAGEIPSHNTYSGREHSWWAGSKEYRVPGRPETDRILEKTLPSGHKVYGWTSTHYQKIQRFSAPHFPDSGWNK